MTTDIRGAARAPLAERALSERVRTVPPSGIRRFFDILATMTDVISLGVGEPDFDTPRSIVEAGVESLREGRTHYTSNYGTLELRRTLAAHLERLYGVAYDPKSELLITVGASEAVDLALRATCSSCMSRRTSRTFRPSCSRAGPPCTSRHASRTISPSTRRRSRRRSRRGPRRSSSATRATRPAPCCPTRSRTSWPGLRIGT